MIRALLTFASVWAVGLLAQTAVASDQVELARDALRKYADADRLVVFRGAICHPWHVRPRKVAEVQGIDEVLVVLMHLTVVEPRTTRHLNRETGKVEVIGPLIMLMQCPDYTVFLYREGKLVGHIGLVGNSVLRIRDVNDLELTSEASSYLHDRFGLINNPGEFESNLPFETPKPPPPSNPQLPVPIGR